VTTPMKILLADDQPDVLEALRLLVKTEGFAPALARSPAAVLAAVEGGDFDVVLLDLNYARDTTSGREGLDLLPHLRELDPTLPVVVMTAWGSVEGAVEAMRRGARDYVQKPWDNARLLATLRAQVELGRALRRMRRLERENAALRGEMPPLVAGSRAMAPVMRLVERIGLPHHLVVLADLRRALREEERQAWQRLIRVISHEINNSLAPIQSIAEGQRALLGRHPRPDDWEEDLEGGLAVIARRAESLGRFMAAYARLARLPPPSPGRVAVRAWVERVAALEKRLTVGVGEGPEIVVPGDEDQLDQLLINLVRNAADAVLGTGGGVRGTLEGGGRARRGRGRRRRAGAARIEEPLRPVLHDQAPGFGHRPAPEPANRRGARRPAPARQPQRRARLRRDPRAPAW
jgi:FixJ family two-component response regulator